ncbi:MAG: shikimate kinase [Bacteroidaceae bacterium]|jgi:shikimate kinase|nr:shikimate kinase [Bacteroidaceae bacterium]
MTRIFLIGYMGAGKTTLGRALAKELDIQFIDLDTYIEERMCKSVSQIFAGKGEEEFRNIERRMLHEAGEFENVVISTGGGTPCFFDNIEYMNGQGTTVFLDVPVERLFIRLSIARKKRPLIMEKSDEELRSFIVEQLAKRAPHYNKAKQKFRADRLEDSKQIEESVKAFLQQIEL